MSSWIIEVRYRHGYRRAEMMTAVTPARDVVVDFESAVVPPARFPSPFGAVHPIAAAAAHHAMAALDPSPRDGKMFGVLVVRSSNGRLGYLRAFSGMLDGTWHVAGFAPPLFDVAARDAFWIDGEAELRSREAELAALD